MPFEWKSAYTLVGAGAGILSFLRLVWHDIRGWWMKPRLDIEFDPAEDLQTYHAPDAGWHRKFATVHVRRNGRDTAKRCVAVLKPVSVPAGVTLGQKEFTLHWAGVDYSAQTTGAEPVEIGLERRRLDVVFTEMGQTQAGSWVAIPIALSLGAAQAYLAPGEYRFKLSVDCENGKGCSKEFTVVSPPPGKSSR